MVTLQRGMRSPLAGNLDPNGEITIDMQITGSAVYDYACFGIDAGGKLSDDRYMVFYNQVRSPAGEVTYSPAGSGAHYTARLNALPASIDKMVFTASIDGAGTMGQIQSHTVNISQNGQTVYSLSLSGKDFHNERAIISIEFYRKNGWRIAAVASGFDGGLGDLLHHFGGEAVEDSTPQQAPVPVQPPRPAAQPAPASRPPVQPAQPQPAPAPQRAFPVFGSPEFNRTAAVQQVPVFGQSPAQAQAPVQPARSAAAMPNGRISLEKKLQSGAPALVSLAKPIQVVLEKKNLQNEVARVALVIDISGSMHGRFQNGTVQEIVNKTLPLAVQFDDDGELDFWYYGSCCKRMDSVNMANYQYAVPRDWEQLMRNLGYGNNEVAVMKEVKKEYCDSNLPAYVLFITDGGVGNTLGIQKQLKEASHFPIFWQFVGVGGSNYGVLEKLDTMSGRFVDNAGFFALDDFRTVPNEELYSRLLSEFPIWLREIRRLRMI